MAVTVTSTGDASSYYHPWHAHITDMDQAGERRANLHVHPGGHYPGDEHHDARAWWPQQALATIEFRGGAVIPECRNLSLQQAAEREACIADREYMEGTVTEVVPSDDGRSASVTWNDGSGNLGIGWPHEPFPLIGDTVRFYGEFGRRVKGADLNGFPVWFRTATEREREHREMVIAADRRKREKFEQDKDRLDAEYAALPEVFRDRIDKFRRTKADWRWECESYEMMCCVDAVKIFDAASGDLLDAPEEEYRAWFEQFTTAPYEDLGRMVPGLSEDHSGNSFSFAVRLAWFYLTDHAMVIAEHGALTPLIDCEEWGCPHPLPDDLVAKYDLDRDVLGGGN